MRNRTDSFRDRSKAERSPPRFPPEHHRDAGRDRANDSAQPERNVHAVERDLPTQEQTKQLHHSDEREKDDGDGGERLHDDSPFLTCGVGGTPNHRTSERPCRGPGKLRGYRITVSSRYQPALPARWNYSSGRVSGKAFRPVPNMLTSATANRYFASSFSAGVGSNSTNAPRLNPRDSSSCSTRDEGISVRFAKCRTRP
jgi:hypothetical protein